MHHGGEKTMKGDPPHAELFFRSLVYIRGSNSFDVILKRTCAYLTAGTEGSVRSTGWKQGGQEHECFMFRFIREEREDQAQDGNTGKGGGEEEYLMFPTESSLLSRRKMEINAAGKEQDC
jgi:hypothetical protein